ncbi:MAG: hypothetical protein IJ852_00970 [Alphaproteobacteria bacterium]|nr:hypothetical protein [Alphaproteobacteria bacterium]
MSRGSLSAQMMNDAQRLSNVGNPVDPSKQYDEISNGQEQVTIETLMRQAGVTAEDIQVVANAHPEIISQIGGGKTCEEAARSASSRGGVARGQCGSGTRKVLVGARGMSCDSIQSNVAQNARAEYSRSLGFQKGQAGGDSVYIGLEATGNYISIDIENEAYGKTTTYNGPLDRSMWTTVSKISPGAVLSFDPIFDPVWRQQAAAGHKTYGNTPWTAGAIWGHAGVMTNDEDVQCDGRQKRIPFSRYGPQIHVSYPKDAFVPKEYALLCIQQAQERANDPNYEYPADVRRRKAATPTHQASRSGRSSTGNRSTTAQRRTSTRNHRSTTAQRRTSTGSRRTTVRRFSRGR